MSLEIPSTGESLPEFADVHFRSPIDHLRVRTGQKEYQEFAVALSGLNQLVLDSGSYNTRFPHYHELLATVDFYSTFRSLYFVTTGSEAVVPHLEETRYSQVRGPLLPVRKFQAGLYDDRVIVLTGRYTDKARYGQQHAVSRRLVSSFTEIMLEKADSLTRG